MSVESKKAPRHKSEYKLNIMLPIVCLIIIGFALCTNYIGENYLIKTTELHKKISLAKSKSSAIESENTSISKSISELDKLIENIKLDLS